jgi:uncharacterized membrane protein
MKSISNITILIIVVVITLMLIPLVLFTEGSFRMVIGLICVIVFPGYAFISLLLSKQTDLSGIERIVLSLGTSIAIVPLIGLVLNYTPWGIRLIPILVSLSTFIIVISAIACLRLMKARVDERFQISIPAHPLNWSALNRAERTLTVSLIVIAVIALGSLIFTITNPGQGERFSEFYILGPGGKAEDYPNQIELGKAVELIVAIANHERTPTSYRVKVFLNGTEYTEIDAGVIEDQQVFEKAITILPASPGPQTENRAGSL